MTRSYSYETLSPVKNNFFFFHFLPWYQTICLDIRLVIQERFLAIQLFAVSAYTFIPS